MCGSPSRCGALLFWLVGSVRKSIRAVAALRRNGAHFILDRTAVLVRRKTELLLQLGSSWLTWRRPWGHHENPAKKPQRLT